jgi:hypothetical protein
LIRCCWQDSRAIIFGELSSWRDYLRYCSLEPWSLINCFRGRRILFTKLRNVHQADRDIKVSPTGPSQVQQQRRLLASLAILPYRRPRLLRSRHTSKMLSTRRKCLAMARPNNQRIRPRLQRNDRNRPLKRFDRTTMLLCRRRMEHRKT